MRHVPHPALLATRLVCSVAANTCNACSTIWWNLPRPSCYSSFRSRYWSAQITPVWWSLTSQLQLWPRCCNYSPLVQPLTDSQFRQLLISFKSYWCILTRLCMIVPIGHFLSLLLVCSTSTCLKKPGQYCSHDLDAAISSPLAQLLIDSQFR